MAKSWDRGLFLKGIWGAAAGLIATFLFTLLFPIVVYPPTRVGALIRDYTPGNIVTAAIEAGIKLSARTGWGFLEHGALMGLSLAANLLTLLMGGAAALCINYRRNSHQNAVRALIAAAIGAFTAALLALTSPEGLTPLTGAAYLGASYLFATFAADGSLSAAWQPKMAAALDLLDPTTAVRSRRRFIRRSAGLAATALLAGSIVRQIKAAPRRSNIHITEADQRFKPPPRDPVFPTVAGHTPEITPTGDFYVVDINIAKPVIDQDSWRLRIDGLVSKPYELTFRRLQTEFNVIEMTSTLSCVSNEVGGELTSTAVWRGVRLNEILGKAGVKAGAIELIFRGAEGYSDSISLAKGLEDSTMVAFGMNGEALPVDHGFPARIVVPGIYGMKNVKWLTGIEATDTNYRGYWQKRGWSDLAEVKTQSRFDVPASKSAVSSPVMLAGVAWAGDRGISKVEVSQDGGSSWQPALLKRELSPNSWRHWAVEITPEKHRMKVLVRAADGTGAIQPASRTRTHPAGASGWDSKVVVVRD